MRPHTLRRFGRFVGSSFSGLLPIQSGSRKTQHFRSADRTALIKYAPARTRTDTQTHAFSCALCRIVFSFLSEKRPLPFMVNNVVPELPRNSELNMKVIDSIRSEDWLGTSALTL